MSRPFLEKLEPVADAGFQGMSLSVKEYVGMTSAGMSDRDIGAALRASGLFIAEVSTASRWLSGESNEEEEIGIHVVARFGAEGLNCTPMNAPYRGMDEAVAAFGAICDRAGRKGVRCHIEFVPWTEPHDLRTAWEIVRRADRPNGGLMFDNWHFFRSGSSLADLRSVDPAKIFAVQLSDAPAVSAYDDMYVETFNRLLPGHGASDVVGCIRVLDEIGVDVPYGGEVISPEWAHRPMFDGASELHAALTDVIRAARSAATDR
jgi:sugar phosphate isomerase/epimerase